MSKKKIAFFAEILIADFDGASRTMFQMLDRIDSDKYEFLFFCGLKPKGNFPHEVITLPTMTIPFNKTYKMVLPYFSKRKINKALDAFEPDIIHIASPSPLGNLALVQAKKRSIPVISIYHTHFITYMKYYLRSLPIFIPLLYKAAIKQTKTFYNKTTRTLVPTELIQYELISICGVNESKLSIWPRGIDENLFNKDKRDLSYIHQITSNSKPNILFASRLVWEKNAIMLTKIYNSLAKTNFPYNFIVAGNGVAKSTLENKMPKAYFLDHVNHDVLAKIYASCDVFFFPSDTESFGNVILEAMASGLPCVAANGGGPVSLIENGVNGFLCDKDDSKDYWAKIDMVLTNSELHNSLSQNAITFTRDFSWDRLVTNYFNNVDELIIDNSRKS